MSNLPQALYGRKTKEEVASNHLWLIRFDHKKIVILGTSFIQ
jgi:hypothetical protein